MLMMGYTKWEHWSLTITKRVYSAFNNHEMLGKNLPDFSILDVLSSAV